MSRADGLLTRVSELFVRGGLAFDGLAFEGAGFAVERTELVLVLPPYLRLLNERTEPPTGRRVLVDRPESLRVRLDEEDVLLRGL